MSKNTSTIMLRRTKKIVAAILAAILMLLLMFVPQPALEGARKGLLLCGSTIIPSLFPFLVLSSFIISSGTADWCGRFLEPVTELIFRLPGSSGAALVLGAIGGYPVGADAVAKLCQNGSLTKREAERLLCFAINSSPAFIIGAVGAGFFKNVQAGILLYIVHLLASFTIGLVMRIGQKRRESGRGKHIHVTRRADNLSAAFVKSVTGSAQSIVTICAFVILFSALNSLLNYTGTIQLLADTVSHIIPPPASDPSFYSRAAVGLLEVTNGCAAASGSVGLPAILLTAAILGFSGLSVQFQVISLIKESGISAKLFILTRILHVFFSTVFALVLFKIFPSAIPTSSVVSAFATYQNNLIVSCHSIPAVCAMLFIIAILLLSLVNV
ncbi:putative membrane protein [[Clostridium] cellulosi]|uniref:Putative membrane protein n=1 Tax=[Clostridium] cellulosi TaxID=29343 RepID=A0A078KQT4_9FIRM|nr:putative membrane protein [[Clostridium] cellulosi]